MKLQNSLEERPQQSKCGCTKDEGFWEKSTERSICDMDMSSLKKSVESIEMPEAMRRVGPCGMGIILLFRNIEGYELHHELG